MSPTAEFREALDAFRNGDVDRAQKLAEAAVKAGPSAEWQHLLGLIHCRLGDSARGLENLRAAAEAEPRNAAFQVMLARALVDSGRAADVLALAEPPPITTAALLALWQVRGEAADAAGECAASAVAWGTVAAAAPTDWRAHANLGNALAAQDRWEEAAEAFSRAASLNPDDAELRRKAGAALAQAARLDQAVDHFRAAVEIDPSDVDTRLLLARALAGLEMHQEALGELATVRSRQPGLAGLDLAIAGSELALMRVEAAGEAFERALAKAPRDIETLDKAGAYFERTNQLGRLNTLLTSAEAAGIPREALALLWASRERREGRLQSALELLLGTGADDDPVRWCRLRSKIADSQGDAAEAFQAAGKMNRATKDYDGWRSRAAAQRRRLRELATAITPEWAAALPQLPLEGRTPAFLVGFPRSGTTLVDTFLMGHPNTAVLEERPALIQAGNVVGALADLPNASAKTLQDARSAYFSGIEADVGPGFPGLVIDKQPLNMTMAPLIHCLFQDAAILFAQRHPCDAVLSGFLQGFVPSTSMANFLDIGDAADFYDAAMSVWAASVDALPLKVASIVYEDLVADPEAELRPAVTFLGLQWDDRLLDHQATAKSRGMIKTASYDQVVAPLTTSASGRWKRYEKQLEPVLPILMPWAERLGYRH